MEISRVWTVAVVVLFTAGCSGGKSPEPPPPAPPAKTVFDPLTQQLDRARDAQKAIDASADATRQAVDRQERGDSSP